MFGWKARALSMERALRETEMLLETSIEFRMNGASYLRTNLWTLIAHSRGRGEYDVFSNRIADPEMAKSLGLVQLIIREP